MKCQYCPSTVFRRTRMRSNDYIRIFLLELPIRCLRCRQRQSAPFLCSALAMSSETRQNPSQTDGSGAQPSSRSGKRKSRV